MEKACHQKLELLKHDLKDNLQNLRGAPVMFEITQMEKNEKENVSDHRPAFGHRRFFPDWKSLDLCNLPQCRLRKEGS